MEKKKTQRIIGILVLIALVVMIAPLFFGKTDGVMQEATEVKAPPFPDQPKSAVLATADTTQPEVAAAAPAPANTDNVNTTEKPVTDVGSSTIVYEHPKEAAPVAQPAAEPTPAKTPDPNQVTTVFPQPVVEETKNDVAAPPTQTQTPAPVAVTTTPAVVTPVTQPAVETQKETVAPKPAVVTETKAIHKVNKPKTVATKKIKNTQITKFKSAWAIQVGSFKVKTNAIKLANKLRISGYKAFTREIKTSKGNKMTGVYIGPEFKQASAIKLSMDVNRRLNLKGYVISYQPLEI